MQKSALRASFIAATLVAAAGAAVNFLPVSSASAAAPQCSTRWEDTAGGGHPRWVPSTGAGNLICQMGRGSNSRGVWALQRALKVCYGKKIDVDSDYGPATAKALREVQGDLGIGADGVYGPKTAESMEFSAVDSEKRDDCFPR